MKHSICKGCGKKIFWGITHEGKKIPLDASAPVYHFNPDEYGETIVKAKDMYVSHFSTCKRANDFSASKRKKHD